MAKTEFNLKDLKKNEKGQYILPLSQPVQWGQDTIKELELDIPRAKHLRKMPANPTMNDIMNVIAELAHQPDSVIDELSMGDITRAGEYFGAFE